MKPINFTISKNAIILTLITLFGSVVIYQQIKIRKQQARLELMQQPIYYLQSDTIATATIVRSDRDSLIEANELLKKKVDYYFEYYRESIHNRYKSAFVSHEIADTITIVDCDTWESIPRYTINCDTITGDCQLKMIR